MKIYSMVITDNNKTAVEAISKSTDWEEFGCHVAGTAYDGVTGLKLIHNSALDIMIIGIQMPGFNGLDMIKKIQSTRKDIRFIIISGYSQFRYAQQTIRRGISDYLLKSILTEEMEQTLKHMTDTLHKKKVETAPGHTDSLGRRIYEIRSGKDGYLSIVSQAINYADRNINRNISLRGVCDELLVSMSYFSKCSKKEIRADLSSYITTMKMESARTPPKGPKNRVNEMAYMLGYSDCAYFFQAFKEQLDYAPNDIKLDVKKEDKKNDSSVGK